MSRAGQLKQEERELKRQSLKATKLVRVTAGLVTSLICLSILKQFIVNLELTDESSWAFVQITVVIYFWSWFLAALRGIEIQSVLLNTTGESSKLPFPAYFALCIGFPIGLIAMLLVLFPDIGSGWVTRVWSGHLVEFLVLLLVAFWIWDMLWHWSVRGAMRDRIQRTKANLKGSTKTYLENEQIKHLEQFVFGSWRYIRMVFGIIIISALLLAVLLLGDSIEIERFNIAIPSISFISVATFVFVVFSESWTWIMRLRLFSSVDALEIVGMQYSLHKKNDTENN